MALSRGHTSVKAADPEQIIVPVELTPGKTYQCRGIWLMTQSLSNRNHNPNHNVIRIITKI